MIPVDGLPHFSREAVSSSSSRTDSSRETPVSSTVTLVAYACCVAAGNADRRKEEGE